MSKPVIFVTAALVSFLLAALSLYFWGLLEDSRTAVFVGGVAFQVFLVASLITFFFEELFSFLKKRKKEGK